MKRLLLSLCLLWPFASVAEVEVRDAWIKHLPPSVPMRAGYLVLHNPAAQAVVLVGAASEVFGKVEIHRSYEQDGMMRMEQVDAITIPAGESFSLEPGGHHLMMMMPREATQPGDSVDLVLEFDDGSRQQLRMTVRK